MAASTICNIYMTNQEPWKLSSNPKRRDQIINMLMQAMNLLAAMFEPFMPSFSAKIYQQMNLKRTERHEVFYEYYKQSWERLIGMIPAGHKIGDPQPIFRIITDEEMLKWKAQFGGDRDAAKLEQLKKE